MLGLLLGYSIGWMEDWERRVRLYKFYRGQRKVKYMEALVEVEEGGISRNFFFEGERGSYKSGVLEGLGALDRRSRT